MSRLVSDLCALRVLDILIMEGSRHGIIRIIVPCRRRRVHGRPPLTSIKGLEYDLAGASLASLVSTKHGSLDLQLLFRTIEICDERVDLGYEAVTKGLHADRD